MRTYRFKLCPTKRQEEVFRQWLGTTRYVYNLCLEYKKRLYSDHGISLSKHDIQKELTGVKNDAPWMKEVNAQTLQAVVERLDRAYQGFFRRLTKGETPGFPRFARKGQWNSFLFKQGIKLIDSTSKVYLPNIGFVRYLRSQEVFGSVKTASVKKEASGWYVCLACEADIAPLPMAKEAIGIDLGLKHAVVTSDGEFFDGPNALGKYALRLTKAQRRLSRKKKGSSNRKKAIVEVARLHERIHNARKDFLHKTSSRLIHENQVVIAENLQVSNTS